MPETTPFATCLAERLIRRTTIQSTHQAIAFDAIRQLQGANALAWRRMFLRQGRALALGAAAPDIEFRDFKNHVLFSADAGWGGAAAKAQAWYRNLVAALQKQEWLNVAYCAGVMAHYVIDPLHPLHTGQSADENDIHFALDTAVWQTYAALARPAATAVAPLLTSRADFVSRALVEGATAAHAMRATLIAHFDLKRARRRPPAGLDATGQQIMSDVIANATALVAALIGRAIAEAGVAPPRAGLLGVGAGAWLAQPFAAVAQWRRNRTMRRTVRRMAKEHAKTGRVETQLQDEERVKRDAFAKDRMTRPAAEIVPAAGGNVVSFEPRAAAARNVDTETGEVIDLARQRVAIEAPRPAPRHIAAEPARRQPDAAALSTFVARPTVAPAGTGTEITAEAMPRATVTATAVPAGALGHAAAATLAPALGGGLSNFRDRRTTGLRHRLDAGLDAAEDGSASAHLQHALPTLSGDDVRLLVGAGYATAGAIAAADIEKLCADILGFALTPMGQGVLREAPPPNIETVRTWANAARAARAA